MVLYEFEDGSLVNLVAFESLIVTTDEYGKSKYYLTMVSGTKYNVSEQEYNDLKKLLKAILNTDKTN